jgi:hypothetical protein
MYVGEKDLANVQYGSRVWKKFARYYPNIKDELYAEMLYAVFIVNKKIQQKEAEGIPSENIPAYVCCTVKGYLQQFVAKDRSFGVSLMTYIKMCGQVSSREYVKINTIKHAPESNNDLHDLIEKCYANDRERSIIEQMVAGATHKEIADTLGISKQRVQQITAAFARKVKCQLILLNGERNSMLPKSRNLKKEISSEQEQVIQEPISV